MSGQMLDEIDRAILHALQENARKNTNAAISERVSVSASTVGKRISRLEHTGVIDGYRPTLDYEAAGFPIHVLFICTAAITEREALIRDTLALDGVINVRELMTGRGNVHVVAVGSSKDNITGIAHELDRLGYTLTEEILLREEYDQPLAHFRTALSGG